MTTRRLLLFTCLLTAGPGFSQARLAPATPVFEVASVRPSKTDVPQHSNVSLDGNPNGMSAEDTRSAAGGYFAASHQALWRYISFAYKLSGTQELSLRFSLFSGAPKSGAPSWVTGSFDAAPEFFDISARAPANASIDDMRLMMQALLADRFHLVTHTITATAPVFALVLATPGKTGPALQPHASLDTCAISAADSAGSTPLSTGVDGKLPPVCGVIARVPGPEPGLRYGARAVPLSLFATSVSTMTGLAAVPRPVVDQTGLSGLYDFKLTWVHDMTATDVAVGDNTSTFRDALKRQLGLELKSSRAPITFLIVDHVERPLDN